MGSISNMKIYLVFFYNKKIQIENVVITSSNEVLFITLISIINEI